MAGVIQSNYMGFGGGKAVLDLPIPSAEARLRFWLDRQSANVVQGRIWAMWGVCPA